MIEFISFCVGVVASVQLYGFCRDRYFEFKFWKGPDFDSAPPVTPDNPASGDLTTALVYGYNKYGRRVLSEEYNCPDKDDAFFREQAQSICPQVSWVEVDRW